IAGVIVIWQVRARGGVAKAVPTSSSVASPPATTAGEPPANAVSAPPTDAFDAAQADAVLTALTRNVSACRHAGDAAAMATVRITFSPTGESKSELEKGALTGTAMGKCVAEVFRGAGVRPFKGKPV